MPFAGGKLRLKGDSGGIKKKKKKNKATSASDSNLGSSGDGKTNVPVTDKDNLPEVRADDGFKVPKDRRTEAEKRFEARVAKLEEERARKAAAKSHRERVKEMNEKLATLTEHHDIPRISYSYM